MKNTQQGGKILNQYEIQSLKQRLDETNDIIIAMENKINKLISENNYYRDEGILKSEAIQNL